MSTTLHDTVARTAPVDPVGVDLTRTLKALKLGQMTQTLPERLALARTRKMGHAAFLQLILDDEITRRESRSAMLRAAKAGLDPAMRLGPYPVWWTQVGLPCLWRLSDQRCNWPDTPARLARKVSDDRDTAERELDAEGSEEEDLPIGDRTGRGAGAGQGRPRPW